VAGEKTKQIGVRTNTNKTYNNNMATLAFLHRVSLSLSLSRSLLMDEIREEQG
jgi:hypothetical protein